jgi:hypothetical protein
MISVWEDALLFGVLELPEVLPELGEEVFEEHAPSPAARRPAAATASIRLLVNGLVLNMKFSSRVFFVRELRRVAAH